jgi:DNA-binding XRE family transcriptional regulator
MGGDTECLVAAGRPGAPYLPRSLRQIWETKNSIQSVNAIETGKYDPSLPLAFKLARVFETTIEAIFSNEEGRNPTPAAKVSKRRFLAFLRFPPQPARPPYLKAPNR